MVLFIDSDPGTDDVVALIYLLKHLNHDVVGLSSVYGNVGLEFTTRNLRLIAGYFKQNHNQQLEIFKGVSKPIINAGGNDAAFVHGVDGCGQFFSSANFEAQKSDIENLIEDVKLSDLSAVNGMIEMSKKYSGELVIVAIGPLTNLALAQSIDPDFGSRIKEIFIMGGDLQGYGNSDLQPCAEFNFNRDPEAVYIVLKEIECKKTILPLEPNFAITIKPEVSERWLKNLETKRDLLSNIMYEIIKFRSRSKTVFKLYDLMLAIMIVDPSVVTEMSTVNISVELHGEYTRGKVVYDHYNKCSKLRPGEFKLVNIVSSLDSERIFKKMDELFQ